MHPLKRAILFACSLIVLHPAPGRAEQLRFEQSLQLAEARDKIESGLWFVYVTQRSRSIFPARIAEAAKADAFFNRSRNRNRLQIRSRGNYSAAVRRLEPGLSKAKRLQWVWQATKVPINASIDAARSNDQALQLICIFEDAVGNHTAISYVWATDPDDLGRTAEYPGLVPDDRSQRITVKVLALQAGLSSREQSEDRDLRQDYDQLFDADPTNRRLVAIVLLADSNHTATASEGFIGDLVISD